jgi:outer membrane protein assembly factor BamE (lipoprotein component of BamABCDE complex)
MKFISISTCVIALLLTGCASKTGSLELEKTTPATIDAVIKRSVTTAEDIRTYLGNPLRIEYTSLGHEQWTYIYRRTDVKARTFIPIANLFSSEVDTSEKVLVITFDRSKKVSNYTISEHTQKNKAGLLE